MRLTSTFYQRGSTASYASTGIASVCLSVTLWYCIKTNKAIASWFLHATENQKTLVFASYPVHLEIRKGSPRARVVYETAVGTNWRFSTFKLPYLRNGAR